MFPNVFEWHWNIEHIIFMGLFYSITITIIIGLTIVIIRTWKNIKLKKNEHN